MRTSRPSRGRHLVVLLAVSLILAACGGSGSDNDAAAGDSGQGNASVELFASKGCAECHGANGEGTNAAPTPLADTRMIIQQFQTRVRNGRGSAMPAYTPDQITDEEIRVIYDWLRGSQ